MDPGEVYFRTTPTFETAHPDYQWLMNSLFIGSGERRKAQVVITFYEVL